MRTRMRIRIISNITCIVLSTLIFGTLEARVCQSHFTAKKTTSLVHFHNEGQAVHPNLFGSDGWFLDKFKEAGVGKNKIVHVGPTTLLSRDQSDEFQAILDSLDIKFDPSLLTDIAEIPGSPFIPLDLGALPRRLSEKVGLTAMYEGSRCYSALFYALEYKDYFADAGPNESTLLLSSELFEGISEAELSKGDVIALGDGDFPTEHVAFMATGELVFHKANEFDEEYISLMPMSHFRSSYDNFSSGAKFFRPRKSWKDFLRENRSKISAETRQGFSEIEEVARKMESYFLTAFLGPFPGRCYP